MRDERLLITFLAAGLFSLVPGAFADWSAVQRLTWTVGSSSSPAIATDSGSTVHVVWHDLTPDNAEIYYKRSMDGGKSWGAAHRLTWTSGNSYRPAISTGSSDTVHVVWEDYTPDNFEVYYKRSTDGGTNWSPAKRLTWTSGWSEYPAVAVDSSDNVHVVWEDYTPGNYEIYYMNSSDGGATWSAARRLTWTSDWSRYPAVAVSSGDKIHVVWQDDTPGNEEIFYRGSTNGGATWDAAKRLTWTAGGSFWPATATDSSEGIQIVWYGYDYTPYQLEIYGKRSSDGGATWSPVQRLSRTSGGSFWPSVAIDSADIIHLTWSDFTPGTSEIYYRSSMDGGATWGVSRRLTWTPGGSDDPAIVTDSNMIIHIVWSDDTPGSAEIYYRKGN